MCTSLRGFTGRTNGLSAAKFEGCSAARLVRRDTTLELPVVCHLCTAEYTIHLTLAHTCKRCAISCEHVVSKPDDKSKLKPFAAKLLFVFSGCTQQKKSVQICRLLDAKVGEWTHSYSKFGIGHHYNHDQG